MQENLTSLDEYIQYVQSHAYQKHNKNINDILEKMGLPSIESQENKLFPCYITVRPPGIFIEHLYYNDGSDEGLRIIGWGIESKLEGTTFSIKYNYF